MPSRITNMPRIERSLLNSGIKVLSYEMPDVESSTVGVWVKTGSRTEPARLKGISHFIEHLLFKGTKKRNALDIAKEIDSVGGVLNAFTSREYTCFYSKVLNKDLPRAINLLSDILVNSVFDSGEVEMERQVVLQEISMVNDTPDDLIHDLFSERLWKGQQVGAPVLGTEKTISSISRDDVLGYYGEHYHSGSVFIAAAGGVKHKKIAALFNKALGGIKVRTIDGGLQVPSPKSGVKVVKRKLEQSHMCLGVPVGGQSHPDRYKLYVLNAILGGGMSSRLFQEIREKRGLAYSVFSYLNLMLDAGALVVYAGTSNEDFPKAASLIMKEFSSLRNKGVGRRELRDAKEQLKGNMLLSLETSDSRMMKLARDEMYFGKPVSIREVVRGIDAVKPRDIRAVADEFLRPSRVTMVTIGGATADGLPASLKRRLD